MGVKASCQGRELCESGVHTKYIMPSGRPTGIGLVSRGFPPPVITETPGQRSGRWTNRQIASQGHKAVDKTLAASRKPLTTRVTSTSSISPHLSAWEKLTCSPTPRFFVDPEDKQVTEVPISNLGSLCLFIPLEIWNHSSPSIKRSGCALVTSRPHALSTKHQRTNTPTIFQTSFPTTPRNCPPGPPKYSVSKAIHSPIMSPRPSQLCPCSSHRLSAQNNIWNHANARAQTPRRLTQSQAFPVEPLETGSL